MTTVGTLKRISAAQLSDLILSGSKKLAVVDVRDDGVSPFDTIHGLVLC